MDNEARLTLPLTCMCTDAGPFIHTHTHGFHIHGALDAHGWHKSIKSKSDVQKQMKPCESLHEVEERACSG